MSRTSNPRAKRSVGKYQVVAKLAEGTMSSVYKARDPDSGAHVAVKVASAATTRDPVLLKRFEQEYRSTSVLCHPNVVRGLEFGWEGKRPFIVMELVDGEDLWTRIERLGKLTEAEAVDYISQVARGLHEAHKHGIIHRDIKPDNVLLTADGQAKLADLGLSKDLESDLSLTCTQRGIGTPNFIAPEQFGDAKHAGVRCDIYALAATLYMALTGQLPFDAPSLSLTLKRKLANDLVAPRKLVPAISERVEWAVRRALLADADRRFSSCPEFIAALTTDTDLAPAAALAAPSKPSRAGEASRQGTPYGGALTSARCRSRAPSTSRSTAMWTNGSRGGTRRSSIYRSPASVWSCRAASSRRPSCGWTSRAPTAGCSTVGRCAWCAWCKPIAAAGTWAARCTKRSARKSCDSFFKRLTPARHPASLSPATRTRRVQPVMTAGKPGQDGAALPPPEERTVVGKPAGPRCFPSRRIQATPSTSGCASVQGPHSRKTGDMMSVDVVVSPELTEEERLECLLLRRLGNRIRNLRVLVLPAGLVLQGRASTYHAKQLAQHAAMELADVPILANDIEVR